MGIRDRRRGVHAGRTWAYMGVHGRGVHWRTLAYIGVHSRATQASPKMSGWCSHQPDVLLLFKEAHVRCPQPQPSFSQHKAQVLKYTKTVAKEATTFVECLDASGRIDALFTICLCVFSYQDMYDGARSGLGEKEEEARSIYTNKKFAFAFAFDGIMIAKTDDRIAVHKISRKLNFLAEQTLYIITLVRVVCVNRLMVKGCGHKRVDSDHTTARARAVVWLLHEFWSRHSSPSEG